MQENHEFDIINKIARNELKGIIINRFLIFVGIVIIIFTIMDGIRNSYQHIALQTFGFSFVSIGSEFGVISRLCTIVAAFIGVIAIADNSNNSIKVLLTKPLYRRDVIMGKFVGLTASVVLLITFSIFFSSLFLILFYGIPDLLDEFILRQLALLVIMSVECALVLGITMLFGLLFDNIIMAICVTITYYFIEWFANPANYYQELVYLSPYQLYFKTFLGNGNGLNDTSVSLFSWVTGSFPYLALLLLMMIAIVAINCYVFTRKEQD